MQILVTGANGFVGEAFCKKLIKEKINVIATSRAPAPEFRKGDPIQWVQIPDIGPDTDWSDVDFKKVDAVVHLASRVHVVEENESDPKAAYWRTNVDGAKCLAETAIKAGVKRFVFVSTVHVHGHVSDKVGFNEASPIAPHSDYAASKAAAEECLQALFKGKKTELVIVRPPLVYGAGVKANFLKLLDIVRTQIPLPLKRVDNQRSFIYVYNLAHFLLCCVEHKKAGGKTFVISDGEATSTPLLLEKLASFMGKQLYVFSVPVKWMYWVAKKVNKENNINSLCGDLKVNDADAKNTLGWTAPYTIDDGLLETVSWYKKMIEDQKNA